MMFMCVIHKQSLPLHVLDTDIEIAFAEREHAYHLFDMYKQMVRFGLLQRVLQTTDI